MNMNLKFFVGVSLLLNISSAYAMEGIDRDNLPSSFLPKLTQKSDVVIPNPPFEIAENRRADPSVLAQWEEKLKDKNNVAIVHGIGIDSQKRLLSCFYEGIDGLTAEELYMSAPHVVLNLRSIVSGTLVDKQNVRTWYRTGFILDVPVDHIWGAHPHDAYAPMEVPEGFNQAKFRSDISDNVRSSSRIGTPEELLQTAQCGIANEVAFYSALEGSESKVSIRGVFISRGGGYATSVDKKRGKINERELAMQLAEKLRVPFYDWRKNTKPIVDPNADE